MLKTSYAVVRTNHDLQRYDFPKLPKQEIDKILGNMLGNHGNIQIEHVPRLSYDNVSDSIVMVWSELKEEERHDYRLNRFGTFLRTAGVRRFFKDSAKNQLEGKVVYGDVLFASKDKEGNLVGLTAELWYELKRYHKYISDMLSHEQEKLEA